MFVCVRMVIQIRVCYSCVAPTDLINDILLDRVDRIGDTVEGQIDANTRKTYDRSRRRNDATLQKRHKYNV